jgi:FAD/FMN-containing dehydrogenase
MPDVVADLIEALGPDVVRTGDAVPQRNCADWSGVPPVRPRAVVLARSVVDVAAAVRVCHAHGQPIVPQGGLTGLVGGAAPGGDEVALSLERMTGIEEIDVDSATMTVLAGTPLEVAQEAAAAAGFTLGIDLGARGSCSVGGNVSTNAGGVNVLRFGMARASVRGLEVVLADGTVVTGLNKMLKNNAGYDWTQLFVGSEGTLGIVTRVVLALHPAQPEVTTAFAVVPDFVAALIALRRLQSRLAGQLVAFEAMWPDFIDFSARVCKAHPPIDPGAGVALIVEAASAAAAGGDRPLETALADLVEDGIVTDAVIAKSVDERRRIWAVREAPPAEYPVHVPGFIPYDVSIPLGAFDTAVGELRAALSDRWPGIMALFYGHVADSNLHLVAHLPGVAEQPRAAVNEVVYAVVARHGGSISAEHGIGRQKRPYLALSRSPEEIALMRRIKDALDPTGILNPGRVL